jgi:hypothetical protein
VSRIAFDSRTPFLLNFGVLMFAVVFAKALGFIPPVAEIRALLRRPTHRMPALSPEEGRMDLCRELSGDLKRPGDAQRYRNTALVQLSRPATGGEPVPGTFVARTATMIEDDLNYYYNVVETLWLGGFGTTIERIQDRTRPKEVHTFHLSEGLAALVERNWLKVQQTPIGTWSDEIVYETWYIPVRPTSR